MRPRRALAVAAGMIMVVAGGTSGVLEAQRAAPQVASAGGFALARTRSGLLAHWSFTKPVSDRRLQDTFEFNGSATRRTAWVHDSGHGLKVGVRPRTPRPFKGWFAVTLEAFPPSSVFHVDMARPAGNVTGRGNESEAVFAVQTASTKVTGLINFVEVTSDSLHGSTAWQVDYSHGRIRGAKARLFMRTPQSAHAPRSHEVTVRTDGAHRLAVWFGRHVVFRSSSLHLHMEPPFQPYLEVQSQRSPYVSTFKGFWVTRDSSVTVTRVPPGATVRLVGAGTGRQLAVARATADGVVHLHLPPPEARGRADLDLVLPSGRRVSLGPFVYDGGDHYRIERDATSQG